MIFHWMLACAAARKVIAFPEMKEQAYLRAVRLLGIARKKEIPALEEEVKTLLSNLEAKGEYFQDIKAVHAPPKLEQDVKERMGLAIAKEIKEGKMEGWRMADLQKTKWENMGLEYDVKKGEWLIEQQEKRKAAAEALLVLGERECEGRCETD